MCSFFLELTPRPLRVGRVDAGSGSRVEVVALRVRPHVQAERGGAVCMLSHGNLFFSRLAQRMLGDYQKN